MADSPNSEPKEFMTPAAPGPRGLAVLELRQGGRFAELRALFAPQLCPMVSAETVQVSWAAELGRRGPGSWVGAPVSEPVRPGVVRVPVGASAGS